MNLLKSPAPLDIYAAPPRMTWQQGKSLTLNAGIFLIAGVRVLLQNLSVLNVKRSINHLNCHHATKETIEA